MYLEGIITIKEIRENDNGYHFMYINKYDSSTFLMNAISAALQQTENKTPINYFNIDSKIIIDLTHNNYMKSKLNSFKGRSFYVKMVYENSAFKINRIYKSFNTQEQINRDNYKNSVNYEPRISFEKVDHGKKSEIIRSLLSMI